MEKETCYCLNLMKILTWFRSSHQRCSVRKGVLRNFANFTGKHLCQSLYFNKIRESGTGVFLWILRNFWQHLFYRTSLGDCFLLIVMKWLWQSMKQANGLTKALSHLLPMHPFSTPWKRQKTLQFSDVFSA